MKKLIEISPNVAYIPDITIKIADENSEKNSLDSDVKIAFKIRIVIPTQRKVSQCRVLITAGSHVAIIVKDMIPRLRIAIHK